MSTQDTTPARKAAEPKCPKCSAELYLEHFHVCDKVGCFKCDTWIEIKSIEDMARFISSCYAEREKAIGELIEAWDDFKDNAPAIEFAELDVATQYRLSEVLRAAEILRRMM